MTLEEAIIYAEAVAKAKEREAKENRNHGGWAYDDEATKCSACAAEHRQLAEWLKELKERRGKDVSGINAGDMISRHVAIDAFYKHPNINWTTLDVLTKINALPSAQPEPLSDAFTKAVWIWLLDYQIKVAELNGKYSPYEVLSWVVNDWRKEHE